MLQQAQPANASWSPIKKLLFRFFCIYFILYSNPWDWFTIIPGLSKLIEYYYTFAEWATIQANSRFFQVFGIKDVHPVYNGSGDTSFNWASNLLMVWVAGIGAVLWSVIDFRRNSYRQLNYLLCLVIRYTLVFTAFGYGILKVFALQMTFPSLSNLATPLGDYLPMRFSWLFIGYSNHYEVFSGVMEVLTALLLLYRRTATMGVLLATAVFVNVMMLNLCYDIPVKLYSMNLVLMCLYLAANEFKRIMCFFVLNKPAAICSLYHYPLTKKWMRITRVVLKLGLVLMLGKTFYETLQQSKEMSTTKEHKDFKNGVYDVTKYVINKDSLPSMASDTIRWQNLIIDNNGYGSAATRDTIFRNRYGRGYFNFTIDTLQPVINFKKYQQDSLYTLSLRYTKPDSNTIQMWGKHHNDSLFIELKKSNRHFQLGERQFHWLSEANR